MKIRSTLGLRLAAVLMLSVSAGTLVIAVTPEASAQQMDEGAWFDVYVDSAYNYCDAKLVGAAFTEGGSAYVGKLAIGRKLALGQPDWIEGLLNDARNDGVDCDWSDVPHSYDDAQTLGEFWGVSTWEAKNKVAQYYTAGQSDVVETALSQDNYEPNDGELFDIYANSGYNYCDAKLVGAAYTEGGSAYVGKLAIGRKIAYGQPDWIEGLLAEARQFGESCDWSEVPHSYEDAETLGEIWGVSTWEAKNKVAQYYTDGDGDIVQNALDHGHYTPGEDEFLDVYVNSAYNYCDAKLVGAAFGGASPYEGKIAIGQKLYHDAPDLVEGLLSTSRALGRRCDWNDVPHNYNDAEALGEFWGVSIWEAKTKIAGYYTNGDSSIVLDVLEDL